MADKRLCFFIGEIGATKTPERARANWLLNEIIEPVIASYFPEFEVRRSPMVLSPEEAQQQILNELTNADAKAVREALIRAIHNVHPGVRFEIPKAQLDACGAFLKNFDNRIFSLNYDLLLYWVILHAATAEFKDGFGLGNEIDGFRTFDVNAYCNTYYLHGALHLFLDADLETQKRIVTTVTIINDIS